MASLLIERCLRLRGSSHWIQLALINVLARMLNQGIYEKTLLNHSVLTPAYFYLNVRVESKMFLLDQSEVIVGPPPCTGKYWLKL